MMSSLNISKQHADDMFYKNNPFKPKSNFISKPINPTDKLNFEDEVQLYLEKNPNTQHVDIILHDLNGHIRGKRIDIQMLKQLHKGCYFPLSIYAMDLDGKVVEETGLGKYIGEPDYLCLPILGSLKPCPIQPESNAQVYLTMREQDGTACGYEPRNILSKLLTECNEQDYFPVISAELEFYLYPSDAKADGYTFASQCFDMNAPDDYQALLDEIEHIANLQGIQIVSIVSESAAGQYEINIPHSADVLKICDQVMSLKRIVKQVAKRHHLHASFLAKPDLNQAGSGMHFHVSLCNSLLNNYFSSHDLHQPSPTLLKVITGLIELMPASMAILAPNINSYRRFQIGQHVPLEANWNVNNRNVAIRLPCSDQQNQRFEYRVAGADCNPYLTVAIILTGLLYGLNHSLEIKKPSHLLKYPDDHIFLPHNQLDALNQFKHQSFIQKTLGKDFCELWHTLKLAEHQCIYNKMTLSEKNWDI